MSRLLALSFVVGMAALSNGCAMCCAPFDWDYPCVGGRWERHNPTSGRVGSAFDEAGGPIAVATTTSATPVPANAAPTDMPQPSAPQSRSVIPRNMGETYLPTAP
jgi:hypothetical protein